MTIFGKVLTGCGAAMVIAAVVALPYVFYIGFVNGWGDRRIDWAPLGMAACFGGIFLMRMGESMDGGGR